MKLAVIGNSHVGMIRAASEQSPFARHEFHWMAKAGQGSEQFDVDGSTVLTRDVQLRARLARLGMPDAVDLAACDAAIFVGNTVSAFDIAAVVRSHVVADWVSDPHSRCITENLRSGLDGLHLISQAALSAHLQGIIRAGTTYRLLSALQLERPIPIHVVPQPFASEDVLQPEVEKHQVFRRIARLGIFTPMAKALRAAHQTVFGAEGLGKGASDVILHHQPADTIVQDLFTRRNFVRGSVRLHCQKAHTSGDVLHANAAYGARVLQQVLAAHGADLAAG